MIGTGSGNDHSGFPVCSKAVSGISWCALIKVHSSLLNESVTDEGLGWTGQNEASMFEFTVGEISGETSGKMAGGGA